MLPKPVKQCFTKIGSIEQRPLIDLKRPSDP